MMKNKPKNIEIVWEKQYRQILFLQACGLAHPFTGERPEDPAAQVIAYGGSAGGGKSDALLVAGIIAGLTYPGINIGYFRREYPQLEGPGGAIMRSQELMSSWAKWNGTQRRWTFPTGSVLQFCHCKQESDVYNYQSQQFDVLLIDEATQFTRFQYRYLLTRNRATKPGVVPFTALASNPGNVGHVWFKTEFIDIGEPEKVHEVEVEPGVFEKHIFIPARLDDNKVLVERDPGYRKRLEAQPEDVRRALLYGDWDVFAGQVFKEFRRDIHVVEPFSIPESWRKWRALDFGYTAPACCLWLARDYDKNVYVYRELYVTQLTAYELAKKILELTNTDEKILYTLADPSTFAKTGHEGESIEQTMRKAGVPLTRANNDRLAGKQVVHEHLRIFTGEDGKPTAKLKIFVNCINLIRTLPQLIYDEHNPEDVNTDGEDHAYDALRYGLMKTPARSITGEEEKQRRKRRQKVIIPVVSEYTGY